MDSGSPSQHQMLCRWRDRGSNDAPRLVTGYRASDDDILTRFFYRDPLWVHGSKTYQKRSGRKYTEVGQSQGHSKLFLLLLLASPWIASSRFTATVLIPPLKGRIQIAVGTIDTNFKILKF